MKKQYNQYTNIYFVATCLTVVTVLFMISFAFISSNVSNGSSAKMKQEMLGK